MKTRSDYLNGNCSHREYFSQFVDEEIKTETLNFFGKERILNCNDEHLNNIPLREWDNLTGFAFSGSEMIRKPAYIKPELLKKLKETKEGVSSAGMVCIYKEAARQIKEEN